MNQLKPSHLPKAAAPPKGDKPAAKAAGDSLHLRQQKEKAPAVEDKPFAEFVQQDYLPALKTAFAKQGVQNLELTFEKQKVPIAGYNQADCWQVKGRWQNGIMHQFNIYFPQEDIQGRAFPGSKPSTLEPFLIDERKVTLDNSGWRDAAVKRSKVARKKLRLQVLKKLITMPVSG